MQRFERLMRMIEKINKGRCPSVDDFCREFECSERTVLNDIQYLKDSMRMAIVFDRFKGGYVNEDPKQTLPQIELTEGELFALTLGKDMLTEYSGTAFEPLLDGAIQKICDRLPDRHKVEFGDLSTVVRFKPAGIAPITRKLLIDLNAACDESKIVEMTYFTASTGQLSLQRRIEPYRILENRGAWYVIAWCQMRARVLTFALHRIREYRVLGEHFEARPDVNVEKYINDSFQIEQGDPLQQYVIKFDPLAARYIRERQWHPSQSITEHADGSLTMSFTATRLDEIKRWVLPFGSGAEVLEPQELRDALQQEFENCLKIYAPLEKSMQTKSVAAREFRPNSSRKKSSSGEAQKRHPIGNSVSEPTVDD